MIFHEKFTKFRDKYLFYLVHIKKSLFIGFGNIYYSQSGEDIILSKIFSKKQGGFYVDVGAYHPMHYSNTYLLFKKGWKGINIDPNPDSIKMFNKYRKNDININVGVGEVEKSIDYYTFNHQSHNTFSAEQKNDTIKKSYVKFLGTTKILCLPLKTVLDKNLPNKTKIDLLSIDTESLDMEVLKSNDWTKFRPSVIVVEDSKFKLNNPEESEIYLFLKSNNYNLQAFTGLSLIFKEEI